MEKLLLRLKTTQLKKLIYPATTSAFIVAVIVLIILSTRFLTTNIDKAFTLDERTLETQLIKLDLENFTPVAKKLGINFENF